MEYIGNNSNLEIPLCGGEDKHVDTYMVMNTTKLNQNKIFLKAILKMKISIRIRKVFFEKEK